MSIKRLTVDSGEQANIYLVCPLRYLAFYEDINHLGGVNLWYEFPTGLHSS